MKFEVTEEIRMEHANGVHKVSGPTCGGYTQVELQQWLGMMVDAGWERTSPIDWVKMCVPHTEHTITHTNGTVESILDLIAGK